MMNKLNVMMMVGVLALSGQVMAVHLLGHIDADNGTYVAASPTLSVTDSEENDAQSEAPADARKGCRNFQVTKGLCQASVKKLSSRIDNLHEHCGGIKTQTSQGASGRVPRARLSKEKMRSCSQEMAFCRQQAQKVEQTFADCGAADEIEDYADELSKSHFYHSVGTQSDSTFTTSANAVQGHGANDENHAANFQGAAN